MNNAKHISTSTHEIDLLPGLALLLSLTSTTLAQENQDLGRMQTFENPRLVYLEKEYGFKPDRKWLNQLRLASLRFGGGCSASFVSPKGLIMTNHHCARGNIAQVQGQDDWIKNGFYAKALEADRAAKGEWVDGMALGQGCVWSRGGESSRGGRFSQAVARRWAGEIPRREVNHGKESMRVPQGTRVGPHSTRLSGQRSEASTSSGGGRERKASPR